MVLYYFRLGEMCAILWFGVSALESSGSIHNSSPVQRECAVVNVALITEGC